MRALFFVNSFEGGGAERVCVNLAKQLDKMEIKSDFVTIYGGEPEYDLPDHIRVMSLEVSAKASMPVKIIAIFRGICKVNLFVRNETYLLITAHLPLSHIMASMTVVRKSCLYVMHVTQHLLDKRNSLLYKAGLRMFLNGKKIVTVSNGLEHELVEEYGIKADCVTTIYNPCSVAAMEVNEQIRLPCPRPYILVLGRLEEQKNPLMALELYYRGRFFNKYDLVYLGKGSLEKDLKKKIEGYHLQSNVYLVGFQKNVKEWLMNASLLLSSSRQEGLPLNLVEALTCGIPVVAVDCPYGPNEILTGELKKYLIDPEREFQKSICVILSALEHYPEISEKYYSKFEDAVIVQRYLHIWKEYFEK